MSKSLRRNYRNKNVDSDDDSSNSKSNLSVNDKITAENRSVLSFGDELDEDIDSFKEKKSSQSKKLYVKTKEPRKTYNRITNEVAQLHNDLDIHVQHNLKLIVKEPSPPVIVIDINDYEKDYARGPSNLVNNIMQKGDIPDAAAIDHAKKQRELAKRQIKVHSSSSEEDDVSRISYIKCGTVISEHGLNLDDSERIAMIGQNNTFEKDRQMIRNNFLSVEHGSDRDSDQENEWESRQLQKAINRNIYQLREPKKIDWQLYTNENFENDKKSAVLLELNSISLDDLSVMKLTELLTRRKEEINESKYRNSQDVYKKQQTLCLNEDKAILAKAEIPVLEKKFNCFNNFRKYIAILVECFDEKMEKMVHLEKKFLKIHKERSEKLIKRNRQDVQDQFDEIILSTKSSAIQSTFEMSNRTSRISDRESRRLRRIRTRETMNIMNHYEGLSSDDEEPKSAISSRQNEIEQIKTDANQLFSDTDPEYCSLEKILNEFVEVKHEFEHDYKDAYINGFLGHVVSPLIRLELITWNTLQTPHFHKWNWFKILIQFTKNSIGTEILTDTTSIEYGDLKIIPSIFDKVIIPKLTEWVSIWNPLSKTETQNLVKFISKLVSQIPTFNDKNNNVKELIKAIVCRCNECIVEDIAIPLYIEQYKENPSGQPFQFFQHQMWAAIKTFTNIMMFHEIIEPNLLCKLALEGILNNYIITGLVILSELNYVNDIITKVSMIKYCFPEDWVSKSEELKINIVVELNSLIRFINKFGATHKKDKAVISFAFSILDHFNVGRGDLLAMLKD